MPAINLKVFISSPGDVGQERLLAARVLERLQGEFAGFVELEPILWEHEPLRATGHFQEQIVPPSETDIVVCILWSRLGTRLPEQFHREDGTLFDSGTEWEFEDAARSHRERGKPHLLVYRKTAEPLIGLSDHQAILQRLEQKQKLDTFIDRWFGSVASTFRAAFHAVQTPDHFEELLETHLSRLIREELPQHVTEEGEAQGRIRWHKGSPFRGLAAFDVEHHPVFFGRTRAIGEIKNALLDQAAGGSPFVVVFGMSGCGKSSLVRAGLLPTLTHPGVVEGIGLWRWCIFRPSDAAGDMFDGLATALLAEQALPELEAAGMDAHELAALFREAPQRVVGPLRMGLKRASEEVAAQEKLNQVPEARLAIVIDQMEEMFTREGVSDQQREGFVAVLSALARSGLAWVIATMRSDFYPRCAEVPELVALKEGAGQYDLMPPTFAEIGQMIRHPARAAGVRFEVNTQTRERLDDVIHEAAARHPEALPLLEFTLDELFQQCTDQRVLTFAAYEQLGGMEGALARRAEEVLTSLEPPVQAALPSLLRALVTVGRREGEPVASRRVQVRSLAASGECKTLLEALVQARLLVTDRADDGEAVVGVAHEALLRHWPRVQKWLEEDRDFLRTRDRVAAAAEAWREEDRRPEFLLPVGKPLTEAEDILIHRRQDLDSGLVDYIEASRAAASRARRRKKFSLTVVGVVVSIFALVSFVQWQQSQRARTRTLETALNFEKAPPLLLRASKQLSIPILQANYQGLLAALEGMPGSDRTLRARAVSHYLQAALLRQQSDLPKALASCNQAIAIGTQLVGGRHPNAEDEGRLAMFYDWKGQILQDQLRQAPLEVSQGKTAPKPPVYHEAVTAFEEAAKHAEAAIKLGSADAPRRLWAYCMRKAELQLDIIRSGADYEDVDEAVAACKRALQLAEERVKAQGNFENRSELVLTCEYLGDALSAAGDRDADARQIAKARSSWTEALGYFKKGQDLLLDMAALPEWNSEYQGTMDRIQPKIPIMQKKVSSGKAG